MKSIKVWQAAILWVVCVVVTACVVKEEIALAKIVWNRVEAIIDNGCPDGWEMDGEELCALMAIDGMRWRANPEYYSADEIARLPLKYDDSAPVIDKVIVRTCEPGRAAAGFGYDGYCTNRETAEEPDGTWSIAGSITLGAPGRVLTMSNDGTIKME